MPAWDSAFLLADFKRKAGLQEAAEYDDDAELYPRLSIAQNNVVRSISSRFPNALYSSPFALTRATDGKTYSYGLDAQNNPILPMGTVQIAPSLSAFSGDSFVGWKEGLDFMDEGTHIRMMSNRSFGGTLYCRAVLTPPDISSSVNPILAPADARELISIQAVLDWADDGGLLPSVAGAQQRQWNRKFPEWMLTYKKRFRGGGGLFDPARWYFAAPDLGTTGA
jgi:hypothetical protein